jgi:PIN domain nuclease of toxin-antitoxin system
MTYVLDASAVVAFFKKEEGKEKVWDILQEAENRTASVYMSKVNLTEVNFRFIRLLGMEGAAVILNKIYKLPIQMIDTITSSALQKRSRPNPLAERWNKPNASLPQ